MKNYKEVMQALLDGKTLQHTLHGVKVHLNTGGMIVDQAGSKYQFPRRADKWEIYKEPEWYDNIPEEGILCYVWDDVNMGYVKVVTQYVAESSHPFMVKGVGSWKYAKPVPKHVVKQWLNNAPDNGDEDGTG